MAVDLVSIQRDARILASRGFSLSSAPTTAQARKAALMAQVEVELFLAEQVLKSSSRSEVRRTQSEIREFLRSL